MTTPQLTDTERAILLLAAEGKTSREIAAKRNLSVGAIKKHLTHIFDKLDVPNTTTAVYKAMRNKLIE